MPRQLVVIEPHVANYQSLIDQLGAPYSYLLLNADSDGVTQIANYVAAHPGFDAIHLISHGSPGQVGVGTSTLSAATVDRYTAQLNQIGASLNAGGDLLIYGCDVAKGNAGQQLIADISRLTRLDVAASTNITGRTGDWVLETTVGLTADHLPNLNYESGLDTLVGTSGSDTMGGLAGNDVISGGDGNVFLLHARFLLKSDVLLMLLDELAA
jgi:Ca2+-binding RTX toxin-like protein